MTKTELLDLLREAQEALRTARDAPSLPYAQWSREQHEADRVIHRINDALAEADIAPIAKRDIEGDGFYRDEMHRSSVNGHSILIERCGGPLWDWTVGRYSDGRCIAHDSAATLDEAKAAALEAARNAK